MQVFDVSAEVMLVLLQRVSVTIVPAQESSGANIKLAKESNKIRVHGNAVQMAAAVPKVEQLIRDFGGEPIVIAVGEAEVALFLGKRSGETLRKLQDETGAYIDFVKEESCVKIRGKSSDADKAKKAIETLLDAERNAIDIEVCTRTVGECIVACSYQAPLLGSIAGVRPGMPCGRSMWVPRGGVVDRVSRCLLALWGGPICGSGPS